MKYYHIAGYWCQLKAEALIQYLFLRPCFYVFWEVKAVIAGRQIIKRQNIEKKLRI